MTTGYFAILSVLSVLFSLIPLAIGIYAVIKWVGFSKERNAYLKEIAEELRRR